MKVYGYDICSPVTGEIFISEADKFDIDYGMPAIASRYAWEKAFTTFKEAKASLVAEMVAEGVDPDLIKDTRSLSASDILQ